MLCTMRQIFVKYITKETSLCMSCEFQFLSVFWKCKQKFAAMRDSYSETKKKGFLFLKKMKLSTKKYLSDNVIFLALPFVYVHNLEPFFAP